MTIPCIQETQIQLMKQSMDNIETNIENIGKKIDIWFDKIDDRFDKLENKYASKWVEKLIIFIWWVMWAAIIGSFMYLILK